MKTNNKRRGLWLTAALCTSLGMGLLAWNDVPQLMLSDHPFLQELDRKLNDRQAYEKPEKVYLHLNKTFFEPGEDIWLAAYIRDAQTYQLSKQSDIVYVELLNPQGAVVQSIALIGKEGKAKGDFKLDANMKGGLYKLRAYTQWQKNRNEAFERDIQVQKPVLPNLNMKLDFARKAYGKGEEVAASLSLNSLDKQALANYDYNYSYKLNGVETGKGSGKTDAYGNALVKFNLPANLNTNDGLLLITLSYKGQTESISRSIPITLGNIELSFFPEGGQWLEGVECGMGFKALNEFDKPADIAGVIVDSKGNTVTTFQSYHQGLGSLRFTPKAGERYTAKLTQPVGVQAEYNLPVAQAKGYTLNLEEQDKSRVVMGIYSQTDEELYLVAQCRGKLYYSQVIQAHKGANSLYIETAQFPIGIAQFTLFDSKRIAQAERLVFVNTHDQLNVKVTTDKEKYLPREKVNATVEVTDGKGNPVSGDFSVAVVDDKLLTFADDKQGHLLSYMLLESDLQGKIEEPNFYFDNEKDPARFKPEVDRRQALDNLMLTHGWRKFTWQEIVTEKRLPISYQAERAIIAGRVLSRAGKPIRNAKITTKTKPEKVFVADTLGNFVLDGVELYDILNAEITADKCETQSAQFTRYQGGYNFYLNAMRKVSGTIMDENGKGISNATVKVPGTNITTKTDSKGHYNLECSEAIQYLELSKESYEMSYAYFYNPGDVQTANGYLYSNDFRRRDLERSLNNVKRAAPNAGGGGRLAPKGNAGVPVDEVGIEEVELENFAVNEVPFMQVNAPMIDREAADPMAIAEGKADVATKVAAVEDAKKKEERVVVEQVEEKPMAGEDMGVVLDRQSAAELQAQKQQMVQYYRAREFAMKDYSDGKIPELRNDFRQTVYWNPALRVENGRAQFSFYNSDDITQFRITVEGFSAKGGLGRVEQKFFTQMPFEMLTKLPASVLMGDFVSIPLTLSNNTASAITGTLTANLPSNMRWKQTPSSSISLAAKESKTIYLQAEVLYQAEAKGNLNVQFKANGLSDGISKPLPAHPRGFPVQQVFNGKNLQHKFQVALNQPIPGSVKARLRVYPNVLDEVMQGISSLIRMPGGCFEQTSSGNYPNILALNYLRETNTSNPALEKTAKGYLDQGYKILVGYESPGGGFDWWGRAPAHEALSAYGLMQFVDMKAVYDVDQALINRTAKWLLSRRDNKGSWVKNPNCLHTWANSDITDAYIVYALASSGYAAEVGKELDKSYNDALKSEDPYLLGLMANALLAAKDARAKTIVSELAKMQQKDGSFKGLKHSIVNSTGKGLDVETTALVALAMMSNNSNMDQVGKAIDFLQGSQDFYGYGSTQGTVLSLKALLEYTKQSKRAAEDGVLAVYLDNKKVGAISYKAGQRELDTLELGKFLTNASQVLDIRYEGTKSPLPYDLEVTYATRQPQTSEKCPYTLTTDLMAKKAKMGETVRLTTTIQNKENRDQPVTMVMVGIPAGLSLQPWQLKELQEKKAFDYYEIFKGFVVFHFERMNPNETRTIAIDLKADIPGTYEAPASSAFLYYNYEHKVWNTPQEIVITD